MADSVCVGVRVGKKFPGYGKGLWFGQIVDGPTDKGKWCVQWKDDESHTWHPATMLAKHIVKEEQSIIRAPVQRSPPPRSPTPSAPKAAAAENYHYYYYSDDDDDVGADDEDDEYSPSSPVMIIAATAESPHDDDYEEEQELAPVAPAVQPEKRTVHPALRKRREIASEDEEDGPRTETTVKPRAPATTTTSKQQREPAAVVRMPSSIKPPRPLSKFYQSVNELSSPIRRRAPPAQEPARRSSSSSTSEPRATPSTSEQRAQPAQERGPSSSSSSSSSTKPRATSSSTTGKQRPAQERDSAPAAVRKKQSSSTTTKPRATSSSTGKQREPSAQERESALAVARRPSNSSSKPRTSSSASKEQAARRPSSTTSSSASKQRARPVAEEQEWEPTPLVRKQSAKPRVTHIGRPPTAQEKPRVTHIGRPPSALEPEPAVAHKQSSSAKPEVVDPCIVCGKSTLHPNGDPMPGVLMCEGDESHECHLRCSGLKAVPEGDWYCSLCTKKRKQEKRPREVTERPEEKKKKKKKEEKEDPDWLIKWAARGADKPDDDESDDDAPMVRQPPGRRRGVQEIVLKEAEPFQQSDDEEQEEEEVELDNDAASAEGGLEPIWSPKVCLAFRKLQSDLLYQLQMMYTHALISEIQYARSFKDFVIDLKEAAEIFARVVFWGGTGDSGANSITLFPRLDCPSTREFLEKVVEERLEKSMAMLPSDRARAFRPTCPAVAKEMSRRWLVMSNDNRGSLAKTQRELGAVRAVRTDAGYRMRQAAMPLADRSASSSAAREGSRRLAGEVLADLEDDPIRTVEIYSLDDQHVRCRLSVEVLRSLRDRFRDDDCFLAKVFSMMARYESISSDAGQHASVPHPVMEVLAKWGCEAECFASPFNATLPQFCSPFHETDSPFGSLGSFFAFRPKEGNFEVNPPFSLTSTQVSDHVFSLLKDAQAQRRPLAFTFIHTTAHARVMRRVLGQFLVSELAMPPNRHYYREGKFYARNQQRAYVSPLESVVFFLMTSAATEKWPIDHKFLDNVRRSFSWPIQAAADIARSLSVDSLL